MQTASTLSSLAPRAAALLAALLAALALALAAAPPPAQAAGCTGAGALPGQVRMSTLRSATLCLLNRERTRRGLVALRENGRLSTAALRHAQDMVRRSYFSHDSTSGASFSDRIRLTGYISAAQGWTLGENIAWGTGSYATPASIVRMWMNSSGHRANILRRSFREIGLGIAPGAPVRGYGGGATYVTDFGTRR